MKPNRPILAALALVCLAWALTGCEQPKPKMMLGVAAQSSVWSDAKYAQYTLEQFTDFAPAQKRIDLGAIDYPLLHAAVFYETNRRRALNHLPLLRHDPSLEGAAWAHSRDMAARNYLGHQSSIPGLGTMEERLEKAGIHGPMAENVATAFALAIKAGQPVYGPKENGDDRFSLTLHGAPVPTFSYDEFAKALLDAWMNSPGQRANILAPEMKVLGVGAAYYEDAEFQGMSKFKVTQNFAAVPAVKG
jgi:uncharacterized protein YkwD